MSKLHKDNNPSQTETLRPSVQGGVKIGQAAKLLGVSVDTLRNWEASGKLLPYRTAGGTRKYRKSDLKKFTQQPITAKVKSHQAPGEEAPNYILLPAGESIPSAPKAPSHYAKPLQNISFGLGALTLILAAVVLFAPHNAAQSLTTAITDRIQPRLAEIAKTVPTPPAPRSKEDFSDVLGRSTQASKQTLEINTEVEITGHLEADNIVNTLTAGENITIGGTASNPIVSFNVPENLINTINNATGALVLAQGSDIVIETATSGTATTFTIKDNSDLSTVRSRGGCSSCITASDVAQDITISSAGHVSGNAVNSGLVAAAYGGTGLSSYAAGSLIYAAGSSTLTTLAPSTAGYQLTVAGGVPTWATATCPGCLVQVPTSNTAGAQGADIIAPSTAGAQSLSVLATSGGGTADIFNVKNAAGSTTYLRVDSAGDTYITNNLYLAGGTTYSIPTSGIPVFSSIQGTAIGTTTPVAGNFTTIGATNPGTGAFTTLSSSGATTLGSGASSTVSLGNATSTFSLASTGLNISSAGALTGVTGISNNGGYTQTGTSANTFTGTTTFSNATYSALFTGGNVGIGDTTPAALFTVGNTDPFRINSSGAITAATGILSAGSITFSSVTNGGSAGVIKGSSAGVLSSGTVDISSSEVTGTLPVANGATGITANPTNGQLLIGVTATGIYDLATLTSGQANMTVTNGAGSISLAMVSTPTFTTVNGLSLTSNADGFAIAGGTSSRTGTVTGSNITLSGGGNTLTMTGNATLNQNVTTASSPLFASLTLESTSNQLVLGTTTTTTLSGSTPASSRTYTIPDFGSNDTFVGIAATQILTNKTFTSPTVSGGTLTGNTITGGTINSTPISGSTGAFTTLSATGAITLGNNTSTVAINSSSWDISSAGAITGITGLSFSSGNFDQSASSGTFASGTGAVSLNGDTTIAAGKNLTLSSASNSGGTLTQTFSSSTNNAVAQALSVTNSNTSGSSIAVNGMSIPLTNATNTNSSNTLNGINFPAASNNNSNTIYGINFLSATGITNFLQTPSIDISSAGVITGSSISGSSNTLTNIPNSALTNSSISVTLNTGLSGFSSIALGDTVTLTNSGLVSVTGTTDQVNVSASTGAVTLSLPQSIGTSSTPSFAGETLTGTLTFSNVATDITTGTNQDFVIAPGGAGMIGVGTTNPLAFFSVGSGSPFQVDSSGNITAINNVSYSWPSSQGSNTQVLANTSGTLTWVDATNQPTKWSSLTNPSGNLSLSMSSFTTTFTSGASTGASNLNTFTDTANNTGTGYLYNVTTASGSTVKPFHVGTATVDAITVVANGNVGIQNTAPGALFSVGADRFKVNSSGQITLSPSGTTPIANITNAGTGVAAGAIGTWATLNTLPQALYGYGLSHYNGYMYVTGGWNGGAVVSTVYSAQVKADGTIGTWATLNTLPALRYHARNIAANGYLFVVAGWSDAGTTATSTVYSAKINGDGTIGTWNTLNTLPQVLSQFGLTASIGYLFVTGGDNGGAALSTVYSAQINGNGTIGTWQTLNTLPALNHGHNLVSYNNTLFVLGGCSHSCGHLSTVYSSSIKSDGTIGTWNTLTQLPQAITYFGTTIANGYIFTLGGTINGATISTVYSSQIKTDGTIGSWSTLNTIPVLTTIFSAVSNNGYLFMMGGSPSGGSAYSTVYSTPLGSTALASNTSSSFATGNLLDLWNNSLSKASVDYNGDLTLAGTVTAGQFASSQNALAAGGTGTYATVANLPTVLDAMRVTSYNGYLYVLGGFNNSAFVSTVYSAKVNADGTTGGWLSLTGMPSINGSFGIVANSGYLFVVGGYNGTSTLSTVYSAKINGDGSIGSWNTLNTLPTLRRAAPTVAYNGYLYIFGGTSGSMLSTVNSAQINGNGTIGTWATLNTLPQVMSRHAAAVSNGYVFVVGGSSDEGTTALSTVYSAPLKSDGTIGTWATLNTLPAALMEAGALTYNGYLFTVGGYNGSAAVSTVYASKINTDGTIGGWSTLNTLPQTIRTLDAGITNSNGYMFIAGGFTGSTRLSTVYSTPLQSTSFAYNMGTNGTPLAAGNIIDVWNGTNSVAGISYNGTLNTTTGVGINQTSTTPTVNMASSLQGLTPGATGSYQTLNKLPVALQNPGYTTSNGYIYILGGNTGSAVSTVYMAKTNADGTISAWNSLNTLPAVSYGLGATAYNGYLFVSGGWNGSAALSTVYSAKINNDGTIGSWNTLNTLPTVREYHAFVAASGYLFAYGGTTDNGNTGEVSTVYSAKINSDGTIGSWATLNTLPVVGHLFANTAYNNYLYMVGGNVSTGTLASTVYSAPIKSDGTIGTWATLNTIPVGTQSHYMVLSNGYFYIAGGYTGSGVSTVYSAKINNDGTTGVWARQNNLPTDIRNQGLVSVNGYMFVVAGYSDASSGAISTVYSTPLQSTSFAFNSTMSSGNLVDIWNNSQSAFSVNYAGNMAGTNLSTSNLISNAQAVGAGSMGSYATLNNLPVALNKHGTVSYNGYIYVVGGVAPSNLSTVYSAKTNADGTIGSWTALNTLPISLSTHATVAANGYLFVLGGDSGTAVSTVYSAQIKSDGTIGSWNTLNTLPAISRLGAATSYNGYLYFVGGFNDSVFLSTVYSAQINGNGTIGAWQTLNTLPLLLGHHAVTAANGFLFVTGGGNSGANRSTVYSAQINGNGTIGAWATLNTLPAIRFGHTITSYNSYLYVLGGNDDNSVATSTVYSAQIKSDGTISVWTNQTPLPQILNYPGSTVTNGYLFITGGSTGTRQSTVYSTPLQSEALALNTSLQPNGNLLEFQNGNTALAGMDASGRWTTSAGIGINQTSTNPIANFQSNTSGVQAGSTGAWQSATNLPQALYYLNPVSYNGYIFTVGGYTGSARVSVVYSAQVKADGTIGPWSSLNTIPATAYDVSVVAYNGYLFAASGVGATNLSTVYSAVIKSDGTIGTWSTLNTLPTAMTDGFMTAYNGYLFIAGGQNGAGAAISTVYSAQVLGNGTIGTWQTLNTLPTVVFSHSIVASNGYLYFVGGFNGSTTLSTVYSAPIRPDGTIGSWTATTSTPIVTNNGGVSVANGYMYLVGGSGSTYYSSVHAAKLNGDGTVGAWTAQQPLPVTIALARTTVSNGFMYIVGGINASNATLSTVYSTPLQSTSFAYNTSNLFSAGNLLDVWNNNQQKFAVDYAGNVTAQGSVTTPSITSKETGIGAGSTGTWQTVNPLPTTLRYHGATSYNGYLFAVGGCSSSCPLTTVYSSKVNVDGTIGAWSTLTALPSSRYYPAVTAANGYLFVAGGQDSGSTPVSTVYAAKINADGTIGSWNTLNTLPAIVVHNTLVSYNGYLFSAAGFNGSSTNQSTVFSAQINSNGTIGTWQTLNTLPQAMAYHSSITANGYLFITGGHPLSTVYSAPIKSDGTIGTWATLNTLPLSLVQQITLAANGYMYVLGGSTDSSNGRSTVFSAQIKTDGTIGSWSTLNTMPQLIWNFGAAVINGYLFAIGGDNNGALSTVYSTPVQSNALALNSSNATTGSWNAGNLLDVWNNNNQVANIGWDGKINTTSGIQLNNSQTPTANLTQSLQGLGAGATGTYQTLNNLPVANQMPAAAAYGGYVFVVGGEDASNPLSTVYSAKVNADGTISAWNTLNTLPAISQNLRAAAYNGYLFVAGGRNASADLSTVYSAQIKSDGTIGTWQTLNTLPTVIWGHNLVATNGYLFSFAGSNTSSELGALSTVYSAAINSNGTIGTWQTLATLPAVVWNSAATTYNGYIYILTGENTTVNVSTVYGAQVRTDGTIGAWQTLSTLPVALQRSSAVAYNGYLYLLGGYNASTIAQSTVYSAIINTDGTIGSWSRQNNLPAIMTKQAAAVSGGYLVIAGGYTGSVRLSTVYSTPLQSTAFAFNTSANSWSAGNLWDVWNAGQSKLSVDYAGNISSASGLTFNPATTGTAPAPNLISNVTAIGGGAIGTWNTLNTLPVVMRLSSGDVYNGYIYVVGGLGGGAALSTVYMAKANTDGTIGSWQTLNTLPVALNLAGVTVSNEYLFVMGGRDGGTHYSTVYSAKINPNGTLGTWNTLNTLPTVRSRMPGLSYNGYLYVIAGSPDGGVTALSTVYGAQILGNGTIGTWQTLTALPAIGDTRAAIGYGGYLWVFGGCTSNCGTKLSTVYSASILPDGTIGTWATLNTLPDLRAHIKASQYNGYVYITGGLSAAAASTVYSAQLKSDGTIGTWNTLNTLPAIAYGQIQAVWNGYLYSIAGFNNSTETSTAYSAALGSSAFVANSTNSLTAGNLLDAWNGGNSVFSVDYSGRLNSTNGVQINNTSTTPTPNLIANINNIGAGGTGTYQTLSVLPQILFRHTAKAYNGYIYVVGGFRAAEVSTVYSAKINADGSLAGWNTLNTLPTVMRDHAMAQYNGYLFVVGGYNGTVYLSTVYSAKINADGTIGSWNTLNTLPALTGFHTAGAANGYLYSLGGQNGGGNLSTVYSAQINGNGTIGTWQTLNTMPATITETESVITNGYLYLIGGHNTNPISTVYAVPLKADGTIGTWATLSTIPALTYGHSAEAYNGYLYISGGCTANSCGTYVSTVYSTKINSDGTIGTWATLNTLPTLNSLHASVISNGNLFIVGGSNAGGNLSTVYSTPLQSDAFAFNTTNTLTNGNIWDIWNGGSSVAGLDYSGRFISNSGLTLTQTSTTPTANLISSVTPITAGSVGTWQTLANLPNTVQDGRMVSYNGYLFFIGGISGGSLFSTVYSAKVNADGTIGPWTSLNTLPVRLQGVAEAVSTNGYLFVMGGFASGGAVSTVYSSKINSDGTIGSWNTLNTLPAVTYESAAATYNNYLFITGGSPDGGGTSVSTVYSAQINGNGTIGTWQTLNTLPGTRFGSMAVTYNGYLFVVGGASASATVWSAAIKNDGTIGAWQTLNTLPATTATVIGGVANGYLYAIGHGTVRDFYSAPIKADGTLGSWATLNTLPKTMYQAGGTISRGYLFLAGGTDGSPYSTVYSIPLQSTAIASNATSLGSNGNLLDVWNNNVQKFTVDSNGGVTATGIAASTFTSNTLGVTAGSTGTYQTLANLPTTLYQTASASYNGYIYILGGYTGAANVSTVYYAQAKPDGTIGPWLSTSTLPSPVRQGAASIVNGYLFFSGGSSDAQGPNSRIYGARINADGSIGSWNTLTAMPVANFIHNMVSYNGYLFVLGGDTTGLAAISTVYSVQVNGNGTLGTWQTLNTLPALSEHFSTVAYNGYLFTSGGTSAGSHKSTVYSAPIKSDGTIGSWTALNTLPSVLFYHKMIAVNNYLYSFGGNSGSTNLSVVYSAQINSDGTIGKWSTLNNLPGLIGDGTVTATNSFAYILGGNNGSVAVSTVYSTPLQSTAFTANAGSQTNGNLLDVQNGGASKANIDSNGNLNTTSGFTLNPVSTTPTAQFASSLNGVTAGSTGTWTQLGDFPFAAYQSAATAYGGYVFAAGFYRNGDTNTSLVYSAQTKADGTLGPWISTTAMPETKRMHSIVAYQGYLFVLGGAGGSNTATSTVYSAKINSDGTVGTWNTLTVLPGVRDDNEQGAIAWNGYLYYFGGSTDSGTTIVSTVYSAPILADGKIGSWATLNTLPQTLSRHTVTTYNNFVFVVGGYNGSLRVSTVYSAPLKADGTIGTWATLNTLPAITQNHRSLIANGYLYVFGGNTGSIVSTVYSTKVASDGTIGSWARQADLPILLDQQAMAVSNGYAYIVTGEKAVVGSISSVYSVSLQSTTFAFNTVNNMTNGTLLDVWNGGISKASVDYAGNLSIAGQFQSNIVPAQDGTIGTWQTLNTLPVILYSHGAVVSNGYVYVFGGDNSNATVSTVYSAVIKSDGTIGTWSTLSTMPVVLKDFGLSVHNGYAYITGGRQGNSDTALSTVYSVQLKADGTLGSWATLNTLPSLVSRHLNVAANGYLYSLTGKNNAGTALSTVYAAKFNQDGTIGTWATLNTLASLTWYSSATAYNGYIFVAGGLNGSDADLSTVYSAALKSDGTIGTWATLNTLPLVIDANALVAYNGYLYFVGGSGADGRSTVYAAAIKADGTIGSWTTMNTLPGKRYLTGTVIYNGYLIVTGGHNISAVQSTVYSASLTTSRAFVLNTLNTFPESTALGGSASLLTIQNNGDARFTLDAQGNGRFLGNIYASGAVLGTPGQVGDLAENVPVADLSIEAGDVVVTGAQGLVKSTRPYANGLVGVVSTKPSLEFSPQTPNSRPVALAGRVPVKVSLEGGAINAGDYLTSSSQPGVAMKATRPGMMIAKALEAPRDGMVLAFVNTTYADPSRSFEHLSLDTEGSLIVPQLVVGQLLLGAAESTASADLAQVDLGAALASLASTQATASAQLAQVQAAVYTLQNAPAAVLGIQTQVASQSAELADIHDRLNAILATPAPVASSSAAPTVLDELLSTPSATLASLDLTGQLSTLNLTAMDATVSGIFKSLGDTTFGNTTITGDLHIDGTLSLRESAINAIDTLFIQNSPIAGAINFFNGLLIMTPEGEVVTQNVIVTETRVNQLGISKAPISTSSAAVTPTLGTAKILSGTTSVTISNGLIQSGSQVLITPITRTDKPLAITNVRAGESFDVSLPGATGSDIEFNWWLVQTK